MTCDSLADFVAKLKADPDCSLSDIMWAIPQPALLADLGTGAIKSCNQGMVNLFGLPEAELQALHGGVDTFAPPDGPRSPSAWRVEFKESGAPSIELGVGGPEPHLWIRHPTKRHESGRVLLMPVNIQVQRIDEETMLATIQHQPITAAALSDMRTAETETRRALDEAESAHSERSAAEAQLAEVQLAEQARIARNRDYYLTLGLFAMLIFMAVWLAVKSGVSDSLQTFETLMAMLIGAVGSSLATKVGQQ